MTKLLEQAVETIRKLPAARQDEIARTILALASGDAELDDDRDEEEIDPADLPTLLERLREADESKFATDEEVEATFRRFMK